MAKLRRMVILLISFAFLFECAYAHEDGSGGFLSDGSLWKCSIHPPQIVKNHMLLTPGESAKIQLDSEGYYGYGISFTNTNPLIKVTEDGTVTSVFKAGSKSDIHVTVRMSHKINTNPFWDEPYYQDCFHIGTVHVYLVNKPESIIFSKSDSESQPIRRRIIRVGGQGLVSPYVNDRHDLLKDDYRLWWRSDGQLEGKVDTGEFDPGQSSLIHIVSPYVDLYDPCLFGEGAGTFYSFLGKSSGTTNVFVTSYNKQVKSCVPILVMPKGTTFPSQIQEAMMSPYPKRFTKTLAWLACEIAEYQCYGNGTGKLATEILPYAGFTVDANTSVKVNQTLTGVSYGPRYIMGSAKDDKGKTYAILSIRGTTPKKDWLANIDYGKPKDKTHPGFQSYADGVYKSAIIKKVSAYGKTLKEIIKDLKKNPKKRANFRLLITGYSLGGAAAQLLAIELIDAGMPPECMLVYTLGSPLPISPTSAKQVFKAKNTQTWFHIVNENDPITKVGWSINKGIRAGNTRTFRISKAGKNIEYIKGMSTMPMQALFWPHDPKVYQAMLAYN